MTRPPLRVLGALLALLLVTAGCGGDDGDDKAASATTTTAASSASTTSSTTTAGGAATTATSAGAGATTTSAGTSGPTSTATPSGGEGTGVIDLTIAGGNVEGGVRREKVKQGSQVTLRVTSDVADELHLHTYDLRVDLVPGQSSDLTFLARIPGVFEVELEQRSKKVLELEVTP